MTNLMPGVIVFGIMSLVPLTALVLLGYGISTKNWTPFFKFYGFLLGVKYVEEENR